MRDRRGKEQGKDGERKEKGREEGDMGNTENV